MSEAETSAIESQWRKVANVMLAGPRQDGSCLATSTMPRIFGQCRAISQVRRDDETRLSWALILPGTLLLPRYVSASATQKYDIHENHQVSKLTLISTFVVDTLPSCATVSP
jgi:hypothetical protein